jgi:hypothetical protein
MACVGHEVLTPDLPADNDAAGLRAYADTVVDAIGRRAGLIVVAQSMTLNSSSIVGSATMTMLRSSSATNVPAKIGASTATPKLLVCGMHRLDKLKCAVGQAHMVAA